MHVHIRTLPHHRTGGDLLERDSPPKHLDDSLGILVSPRCAQVSGDAAGDDKWLVLSFVSKMWRVQQQSVHVV